MTAADRPSVTDNARAEAWDEGYWLGINGHTGPGNPYRDDGAVPDRAAGRAETTTDCGGCRGLGKHSPRCHTQPGYLWRRRADRAESLADEIGSNDAGMANRLYAVAGECRARAETTTAYEPCVTDAEGRCTRWSHDHSAETTTATDEDAEAAVVDALGQSPFAHHEVIPSGETTSTLYITHDDEWTDLASLIVQMLATRGLLATARTRPTETEWGVRGMGVTLRVGSERDARELLAKSTDYVLVRRQVTPWIEADQ